MSSDFACCMFAFILNIICFQRRPSIILLDNARIRSIDANTALLDMQHCSQWMWPFFRKWNPICRKVGQLALPPLDTFLSLGQSQLSKVCGGSNNRFNHLYALFLHDLNHISSIKRTRRTRMFMRWHVRKYRKCYHEVVIEPTSAPGMNIFSVADQNVFKTQPKIVTKWLSTSWSQNDTPSVWEHDHPHRLMSMWRLPMSWLSVSKQPFEALSLEDTQRFWCCCSMASDKIKASRCWHFSHHHLFLCKSKRLSEKLHSL